MTRMIKAELKSVAMLLECRYINEFWEDCMRKLDDEVKIVRFLGEEELEE